MPSPRCCFILRLKHATVLIGALAVAFSLTGATSAVMNVANFYQTPEDHIVQWMLEVIFFLGIHGIVFHSILLLVSIILIFGAVKDIPPLLIPWIAWIPFLIIAIIVNVVLVLQQDSLLAVPVTCFALLIFIFMIYATVVIASQFRELIKYETRRTYLEGLTGVTTGGPASERYSAYFDREMQSVRVIPSSPIPSSQPSSSRSQQKPTGSSSKASMRDKLAHTYARVLMSSEPKSQ